MRILPTPNTPRAPWDPTTSVDLPSSTVTGSAQFRIIAAVRAQSVLLGFSIDTLQLFISHGATFLALSCCYTAHQHPIERLVNALLHITYIA
jgi:hypothetical protein